MSEKGPRKVSSELRDYYARLRTGDTVDEVLKSTRRRRTHRLAEGAINSPEVADSDTVMARRRHGYDGTIKNLGSNYIKPRDTANETGEQEKNDE